MAFSLPNPTSPTNGQSLDATPILANEVAIAQAIASFDGSQIQAGSITGSALAATANPNTLLAAVTVPFVQSGVVWSTVSGLAGTMSGGTIYYNGTPVTVNSVASHTFTASKDTYIDVDKNGNVTYQAVSNNASSPSLTANSIRVAKVVTGSSSISSIVLTGSDTLGNIIYPYGGLSPALIQNPYKFSVHSANNQTVTTNTATKVTFDTKDFDSGANFDVVTNHRFTAPIAGFYQIQANVQNNGDGTFAVGLYKNGTEWRYGTQVVTASGLIGGGVSDLMQLVEGDYVETWVVSTNTTITGNENVTYMSGSLVSAT